MLISRYFLSVLLIFTCVKFSSAKTSSFCSDLGNDDRIVSWNLSTPNSVIFIVRSTIDLTVSFGYEWTGNNRRIPSSWLWSPQHLTVVQTVCWFLKPFSRLPPQCYHLCDKLILINFVDSFFFDAFHAWMHRNGYGPWLLGSNTWRNGEQKQYSWNLE